MRLIMRGDALLLQCEFKKESERGVVWDRTESKLRWWRRHINLFRPIMELGHFVGLNLELDGRMLGYY